MKPLIVTNHALEQYASRTGRNQFACVAELINSVRCSALVKYEDVGITGFRITRRFKGDTYYIWYDPKIDDQLLAIIASDGAIKTVLRREMFGYKNPNTKERYETQRGCFSYGYESPKRKGSKGVR